MKVIFADPTPRWVPFTAAALIVLGVWFAGVWENFEFVFISKFAVGLACVLFVAIFFQGRFYWKGQVDRLTSNDGEYFEATTSIWVGRGKRIAFGPHEATDWTATARSSSKAGEPPELGTIYFTVKGKRLEMSFINPKIVDLEALSALNPEYFAKVKADYPQLKSIAGS
jgi:hypothetical protein